MTLSSQQTGSSIFLEFHLLQNFAPSNLNRDDTGSPKEAIFGGCRRARVSSQCFKRAIRLAASDHKLLEPESRAIRTRKLNELLAQRLSHRDSGQASVRIEAALSAAELEPENGKSMPILFLGEREIAGAAELIDQHWDDLNVSGGAKIKKAVKNAIKDGIESLLDGGKAVDVALFGRMLTALPKANQHAACQVAHAISTHKVDREFDYYTAVDDLSGDDKTDTGMIGQIEFNSATFYRYAVLDLRKLLSNLKSDRDLTFAAISAFTEAMVRAIPTGKQNSFAAHNPPDFIGISLRHGSPLNLANAFEKPVRVSIEKSLSEQSVKALAEYEGKLSAVYATPQDQWLYLDLTGEWPAEKGVRHASLSELVHAVGKLTRIALGDGANA